MYGTGTWAGNWWGIATINGSSAFHDTDPPNSGVSIVNANLVPVADTDGATRYRCAADHARQRTRCGNGSSNLMLSTWSHLALP